MTLLRCTECLNELGPQALNPSTSGGYACGCGNTTFEVIDR